MFLSTIEKTCRSTAPTLDDRQVGPLRGILTKTRNAPPHLPESLYDEVDDSWIIQPALIEEKPVIDVNRYGYELRNPPAIPSTDEQYWRTFKAKVDETRFRLSELDDFSCLTNSVGAKVRHLPIVYRVDGRSPDELLAKPLAFFHPRSVYAINPMLDGPVSIASGTIDDSNTLLEEWKLKYPPPFNQYAVDTGGEYVATIVDNYDKSGYIGMYLMDAIRYDEVHIPSITSSNIYLLDSTDTATKARLKEIIEAGRGADYGVALKTYVEWPRARQALAGPPLPPNGDTYDTWMRGSASDGSKGSEDGWLDKWKTSRRPVNVERWVQDSPLGETPDEDELLEFHYRVANAPLLLQTELNKATERTDHRVSALINGNQHYQALRNQLHESLTAARALRESTAAIEQADQETRQRVVHDLRHSLEHGTTLEDENPERSAQLLAPHIIGTLDDLPGGKGIVLRDTQHRDWRFTHEGDALIRTLSARPREGDIIIKLPAPLDTSCGVEIRKHETDLPDGEIAESRHNLYTDYSLCLAVKTGKKEKWKTLPPASSTQHGLQEQLFDAIATGLNMACSRQPSSGPVQTGENIRQQACEGFAQNIAKSRPLNRLYEQYQQDTTYLDASATLWQGLNAGFENRLNSFYILDTTYRHILQKLATEPRLLAQLLVHDRYQGDSVNQKLATMARECYCDRTPGIRLDPEMERFLSDHLSVLMALRSAGSLTPEELEESLNRGQSASLRNLLNDASSLAELRAQETLPNEPDCRLQGATLQARIIALAATPIITEDQAMHRYESSQPLDPRQSGYYRQTLEARKKTIQAIGFNKNVAEKQIVLEDLVLGQRFDGGKDINQLQSAQLDVEQAVKKNKQAELYALRLNHQWDQPLPAFSGVADSDSNSPQTASRRVQNTIGRGMQSRPPSLSSMPSISTLNRSARPSVHCAPASGSPAAPGGIRTADGMTRLPSMSRLPSMRSLAAAPATAPGDSLQATQHQARTVSMSRLPSMGSLASTSATAPVDSLQDAQRPMRATVSMSRLPSMSSLAPTSGTAPAGSLQEAQLLRGAVSLSSLPSMDRLASGCAPTSSLHTLQNQSGGAVNLRSLPSAHELGSVGEQSSTVDLNTLAPQPLLTLSSMMSMSRLAPTALANQQSVSMLQPPIVLPANARRDGSTFSIPARLTWGEFKQEPITLCTKITPDRPVLIGQAQDKSTPGLAADPNLAVRRDKMTRQPSLPTLTEVDQGDARGVGLTFRMGQLEQRTFIPKNPRGGTAEISLDNYPSLGWLKIDPAPSGIQDE